MNIYTMPAITLLQNITTWADIQPLIVISITSVEDRHIVIPKHPNCVDVLYLKFDDGSYSTQQTFADYGDKPLELIGDVHAKQILDFCEKHKNAVNDILINCQAGISRSVGVGIALYNIFSNDNIPATIQHFGPTDYQHANRLVMDVITKYYTTNKNRG